MFTGIIVALGRVESVASPKGAGAATKRLVISTDLSLDGLRLGDSIAVNGVCLTLVGKRGRRFHVDLGPETLARTTLAALSPGDVVHLEPALRVGDALGGHMVSGHVDGVGTIDRARPVGGAPGTDGAALELVIAAPTAVAPYLVEKGSIAVDGVSLTVNWVDAGRFQVMLIPHTLAVTALGGYGAGRPVNLEADQIAKLVANHVARFVDQRQGRGTAAPRATKITSPRRRTPNRARR